MVSTVFLHRYVIHMYRVQCIIDPYLGHTNSLDAKGQWGYAIILKLVLQNDNYMHLIPKPQDLFTVLVGG